MTRTKTYMTYSMDTEARRLHKYWKPSGEVDGAHAEAIRGFLTKSKLSIGLTLLIRGKDYHDDRVKAVRHLKVSE